MDRNRRKGDREPSPVSWSGAMFEWIPDQSTYDIFIHSGQERLRLDAALKGYLLYPPHEDAENPAAMQKAYRGYLQKRIRPAVERLAAFGDAGSIRRLMAEGLVTADVISEIAMRFADGAHPASWLTLMAVCENPLSGSHEIQKEITGKEDSLPGFSAREQMCGAADLLYLTRRNLYSLFPFLDAALWNLPFKESTQISRIGTDGISLLYDPFSICSIYKEDPKQLARLFLHIILHCIYRHWMLPGELREQADSFAEKLITEEVSHHEMCRNILAEEDLYGEDDHSLWPVSGNKDVLSTSAEEINKRWEFLSSITKAGHGDIQGMGSHLGIGSGSDKKETEFTEIHAGHYEYRDFLSKYTILREEMQLDHESFDYIYYTLGLHRYGDLPLMEPLEYMEGHRLSEIVIAIDTSGSCSENMVRRFLQETCSILERKENFFQDMSVFILQCDCEIQDVCRICSQADWRRYCERIRIMGRGGTDFRPVFRYVEKLRKEGRINDLKCLIYFTDGDGIFPEEAPDYEAVFVFTEKNKKGLRRPDWARQLLVEE